MQWSSLSQWSCNWLRSVCKKKWRPRKISTKRQEQNVCGSVVKIDKVMRYLPVEETSSSNQRGCKSCTSSWSAHKSLSPVSWREILNSQKVNYPTSFLPRAFLCSKAIVVISTAPNTNEPFFSLTYFVLCFRRRTKDSPLASSDMGCFQPQERTLHSFPFFPFLPVFLFFTFFLSSFRKNSSKRRISRFYSISMRDRA